MQKAPLGNSALSRKKAIVDEVALDTQTKNGAGPKKRRVSEEGDSKPVMAKESDWAPLQDATPAKDMHPPQTPVSNMKLRRALFSPVNDLPQTPSDAKRTAKKVAPLDVNREPIKVFLRVRPLNRDETSRGDTICISACEDPCAINIRAPKESKNNGEENRFTFTGVLNEKTSQQEVFQVAALPIVRSLLEGHNGLLFSYGITNAGKTFTIGGTKIDPGILPRTLDVIFNSIASDSTLTPKAKTPFRGAKKLPGDLEYSTSEYDISSVSDMEEEFPKFHETTKISTNPNSKYALMISYFEIYNEKVYDLLDEAILDPSKRQFLKLKEAKNGVIFVDQLKEFRVSSSDEAQKLIIRGQRNRQVANTQLNHDSSRSHSVIEIKLIEVPKNISKEEVKANSSLIRLHKLSIVDLAGSERNRRTKTTGAALKEAANINTSLMTFGRCIEALRYNQMHPSQTRPVPFRDSKLTRLFQEFFGGSSSAKATMIVNASPGSSDYDETIQVLRFSAMAKEMTLAQTSKLDTGRNHYPMSAKKGGMESGIQAVEADAIDMHTILEAEEARVRFEMGKEVAERISIMEADWKKRLDRDKKNQEETFNKKYQALLNMYNERESEVIQSKTNVADKTELREEVNRLERELERLEKELEEAHKVKVESQAAALEISMKESQWEEKKRELEERCAELMEQLEEERRETQKVAAENSELKARLNELMVKTSTPKKSRSPFSSLGKDKGSKVLYSMNEGGVDAGLPPMPNGKRMTTPTKKELKKHQKYALIQQSPGSSASSYSSVQMITADVEKSLTGDGVSVTFTQVEDVHVTPKAQRTASGSSFNSVQSFTSPENPSQSELMSSTFDSEETPITPPEASRNPDDYTVFDPLKGNNKSDEESDAESPSEKKKDKKKKGGRILSRILGKDKEEKDTVVNKENNGASAKIRRKLYTAQDEALDGSSSEEDKKTKKGAFSTTGKTPIAKRLRSRTAKAAIR
ncbi:hypothetical protein PROFUN_10132 [Planoprotostelium fungivorum]|uniref:Kinesin motor domain-containing protein n=1 Tax=Planoprotostelium fungivorum TaxID=1890364 RepID=A0A2P6NES3_9EUKA|nr:hypothetical protein PROFUN_10132 [Planoprotostelium fungivorum]